MSTMWADFEPLRVNIVSSSSMFCRASPVRGRQSQAITGTASTTSTNLPKPTFSKCKRYSTAAATWALFSRRQSSFTFSSKREQSTPVSVCSCHQLFGSGSSFVECLFTFETFGDEAVENSSKSSSCRVCVGGNPERAMKYLCVSALLRLMAIEGKYYSAVVESDDGDGATDDTVTRTKRWRIVSRSRIRLLLLLLLHL